MRRKFCSDLSDFLYNIEFLEVFLAARGTFTSGPDKNQYNTYPLAQETEAKVNTKSVFSFYILY